MPGHAKFRSVSVEDLSHIVKQMVNGALEDTDQATKLRQAIYEEWYFKKMEELKDTRSEDVEKECSQPQGEEISATVTFHRKRKTKIRRRNVQSTDNNESTDGKGRTDETDSSKEIKGGDTSRRDLPKPMIAAKESEETIYCQPEYLERTQSRVTNNRTRDTEVNTEEQYSCNDVRQLTNNEAERSEHDSKELIEVWRSDAESTIKKAGMKNGDGQGVFRRVDKESAHEEAKSELTFELWKKKKSETYKRLFRQRRQEEQRELNAKAMEQERKRIAYEAQVRAKKQQQAQLANKLLRKQALMIEQSRIATYQKQLEEKRIMNERAFKAWKRQKDSALREKRMMMMSYVNQCYQEQPQLSQPTRPQKGNGIDFNIWLNQLDWVLHEKYLRERRHLVRSFYCQPAYYGDANVYSF